MTNLRLMEWILTLKQGGSQQLLLYKARILKELGCTIHVVALEDGAVRQQLEAEDIPVTLIQPKRYSVAIFPLFLSELRRIQAEVKGLIELHNINILQTHLLSVYDFVTPYLRQSIPDLKGLLWTFHNTHFEITEHDRFGIKVPVYRRLYRLFAPSVDSIIAVSDDVNQSIQNQFGFSSDKVVTIENAIPVNDFQVEGQRDALCQELNIPKEATLLLTVGRLTEQKGHRYLLEALAQVQQQRDDVVLLMVGEGEQAAFLKQQAKGLNVHFLWQRGDVPNLMASVDIFVLPSLWEGLPQVLLEAMASRLPIVASDIAGVSPLIDDGDNGRLVPAGNAQMLADALLQLIQESKYAQQLGESAYATVRTKYDMVRLGNDYLHLYTTLLNQASD